MSDTETTEAVAIVFSEAEAAVLIDARIILQAATKQADHRGIYDRDELDCHDQRNLGRIAEACEVAEGAIFNALNVASSRCHCPNAESAIASYLERS